jgi:hypothetical protein
MTVDLKTIGHIRAAYLGDQNGEHTGIPTNPLKVNIDSKLTAFGELLVGQLSPLFQNSFEYTVDNTDLAEKTLVADGTVTQGNGMAIVNTTTTTASSAKYESNKLAKYRPGMGGLARFTTLFTTGIAGTEQFMGLLDVEGVGAAFLNGYAIGYDGVTFGVHRFSNDVLTTIALADCDDPLDGSGLSGMTIDTTKLNVFEIRYQYLGAGAIQFFIEDGTGKFALFHTIFYANLNTEPSVHNPNFHLTMWVNNGGTTTDIIMKSASYAYFIEGLTRFLEIHRPHNSSGIRQKTSVVGEVAIVTVRNKSTYSGKANFIDMLLENLTASIESSGANNLGSIRFVKNATLGGTPSYTDINTVNSVAEYDVAGTTVTGGKELLALPLAGKNDKIDKDLNPFIFLLKHGETITVSGQSAGAATINTSILWSELF